MSVAVIARSGIGVKEKVERLLWKQRKLQERCLRMV
jgi:hypothetical protein